MNEGLAKGGLLLWRTRKRNDLSPVWCVPVHVSASSHLLFFPMSRDAEKHVRVQEEANAAFDEGRDGVGRL